MNRLVVALSSRLRPCGRSYQLTSSCQSPSSTTEVYPRVASSCQMYDSIFELSRRVWGSSSSILKLTNTNCVLGHSRSLQGDAQTRTPLLATGEVTAPLKEYSEIPGPKPWPIVGNLIQVLLHKDYDVTRFHKMLVPLFEEYGPIIKFKFPGMQTMVISTNPDDIETFFRSTLDDPSRGVFLSLKDIRNNERNNYFKRKTGLISENGKEWLRLRSKVQGTLLKPPSVASYLPQVDKTTKAFMERIDTLQAKTGRIPPNFLEDLYLYSIECLGHIALDRELGCLEPGLSPDSVPMQLVRHLTDIFTALNVLEVGPKTWMLYKTKSYVMMETAHNAFLQIVVKIIEEASERLAVAKDDPHRTLSMMETLLSTEGLSKSDVVTVIMDMFVGSVDTTSHSLAFMLYHLAKNPKAQKKLQEEVDAVLGAATDLLPEHLNDMTYLSYAVKESLRIHPITIGTARDLQKDFVMSGYKIPAGTRAVGVNMMICHIDQYFHRAKEFLPERWAPDRPLGPIHPFASLPFSYGTRMCIGKIIAEQEIYTFLIRAMQKYSITFESSRKMKIQTIPFLKPIIPLAFKLHHRK